MCFSNQISAQKYDKNVFKVKMSIFKNISFMTDTVRAPRPPPAEKGYFQNTGIREMVKFIWIS